MIWAIVLVIGSWIGYCYGTAVPGDCGSPSMWNPFSVYYTISALQSSPWAYFAEDMTDSLRQSKKELLGAAVVVASTGAAYALGGQPMAMATLRYGVNRAQQERAKRTRQWGATEPIWVEPNCDDGGDRQFAQRKKPPRFVGTTGGALARPRPHDLPMLVVD